MSSSDESKMLTSYISVMAVIFFLSFNYKECVETRLGRKDGVRSCSHESLLISVSNCASS